MSHPQPTMPPRQFSPQLSPNGNYQLPPNKRAKLSPGPGPSSNPGSPYPNYAASPTATTPAPTPPLTLPSPAPLNHTNNQASPGGYTTPYQQPNGRPASVGMSLTMPTAASTTPLASPQPPTPNTTHAPYSTAKLAPVPTTTASFAPSMTRASPTWDLRLSSRPGLAIAMQRDKPRNLHRTRPPSRTTWMICL